MLAIKCASDARRLSKAIEEFKTEPESVLKDISESVFAEMKEGIYVLKQGESLIEIKQFLINRGFVVSQLEHNGVPALLISW